MEWADHPAENEHSFLTWLRNGRDEGVLFPIQAGWASPSSLPQKATTHHRDQWPTFTRSPKMLFVFAKLFLPPRRPSILSKGYRLRAELLTESRALTRSTCLFVFRGSGARLSISAPCQRMCFRNLKKEESPSETFSRELRSNLDRRSASSVV